VTPALPRALGNGLTLRVATPADAEAVAAFNADILRMQDAAAPQASLGEWTRDLLEGRHPTARASDAVVVEDTGTRTIVSSMILVSQRWSYGGVSIPVGQPELVGTRAEHRGRGLVRAQFDVVHAWSAARGELMQVIGGIPWFYRQFSYEMALPRGGGSRITASEASGLGPTVTLRARPARESDARFLAALDVEAAARHAVWVPRDEPAWRYEIEGHREGSAVRQVIAIVEQPGGEPVGAVAHGRALFSSGTVGLTMLEAKRGTSWRDVTAAAMRHVHASGEAIAEREGARLTGVSFWFLGPGHPVHEVVRTHYTDTPYALYTRVPDLAAFLRAVGPALERRLAHSPMAGHHAVLRFGSYRGGVEMVLEAGRIKDVTAWAPSRSVVGQENGVASADPGRAHALFPDHTFQLLLFGRRSIDELTDWYPDCLVRTGETRALLAALFPRQPSLVWPVL
jgi:hypothetical protein